ncbi:MAG: tetratricopeptide repeat protein [Pirellulales bacterium]
MATVVQRIDRSDIKGTLIAALDDWAVCEPDESRRARLLETTRNADPAPDGWPDRVRDPATWHDREVLQRLAATASSQNTSVYLLRTVGERLSDVGVDSVSFYRQVQREHADSFLANFALANALRVREPEEAVRFYQAALAIRPREVSAGNNLAVALADLGRTDEAMPLFRQMSELPPPTARVHYNLGGMLADSGRTKDAVAQFQRAIEIRPDLAPGHFALGKALCDEKQYAAAEAALGRYLEMPMTDAARRAEAGELLKRCRRELRVTK